MVLRENYCLICNIKGHFYYNLVLLTEIERNSYDK